MIFIYESHLYQSNNLHKSVYKILEGNYKEALELLDLSQSKDGADVDAFHTWEIFSEVRGMKKFKDVYRKKFGRSFKK